MVADLGTDPLREDADFERLWDACCTPGKRGGNTPIGAVLMDQHKIAGVGNIFRTEILYKARVHPDQPAGSIGRPTLERVWQHTVDLMRRGVVSRYTKFTVDEEDLRRRVLCNCPDPHPPRATTIVFVQVRGREGVCANVRAQGGGA